MPVHIAASLQYSFDTKEDLKNGFGYGPFAKSRLKQYLNSLTNFGIHKILEEKSMSYKEDFIKYHLIPGIYCADHKFVHIVMNEFYQLKFERQNHIINWKESQTEEFDYQIYRLVNHLVQNLITRWRALKMSADLVHFLTLVVLAGLERNNEGNF